MHQDGPSVSVRTGGRAVAYYRDILTLASHTTAGKDEPTRPSGERPLPAHHDAVVLALGGGQHRAACRGRVAAIRCAVLGSALLFGGVAWQPAAKCEVLPVGGLQRLLQGGDLLAVTVLELGQLGGQGPHDAAGLVGIGPSFPGRCRGRWGGLLLGS